MTESRTAWLIAEGATPTGITAKGDRSNPSPAKTTADAFLGDGSSAESPLRFLLPLVAKPSLSNLPFFPDSVSFFHGTRKGAVGAAMGFRFGGLAEGEREDRVGFSAAGMKALGFHF